MASLYRASSPIMVLYMKLQSQSCLGTVGFLYLIDPYFIDFSMSMFGAKKSSTCSISSFRAFRRLVSLFLCSLTFFLSERVPVEMCFLGTERLFLTWKT